MKRLIKDGKKIMGRTLLINQTAGQFSKFDNSGNTLNLHVSDNKSRDF